MRAARAGLRILEVPDLAAAGRRARPRWPAPSAERGQPGSGSSPPSSGSQPNPPPAQPSSKAGERPMPAMTPHKSTNGSVSVVRDRHAPAPPRVAPIIEVKDHDAPSVLRPSNMLREVRRQKGLAPGSLPRICVLDPDGDIVRYLRRGGEAELSPYWACYHTEMWERGSGNERLGVIGFAVGGSFAVLVAEQLLRRAARSSSRSHRPGRSPPSEPRPTRS